MARIDNLNNFLTDVAGAIREKTGKKDAINPASFDTEILGIQAQAGDLWLVKNGIEQEYNTKGSTFTFQDGDTRVGSLTSGDGYTSICAKIWSAWEWTFNTVVDFSQYTALHIEWDYTAYDSVNARDHTQLDIRFNGQGQTYEYNIKQNTGTAERNTTIMPLDDTLVNDQVTVKVANTGETTKYLNYPIRIYNIWLEAKRTNAELTEYTNKVEVQRNALNELVEKLHRKVKEGYDE